MREINVVEITNEIKEMCIEANYFLPRDICEVIETAKAKETSEVGKAVFKDISENIKVAGEMKLPVCQDTGMVVVFIEIGQEVALVGGDLNFAINEGVRQGYKEGYLRCSIVSDPLKRVNTNDNTPAVIHLSIVQGDKIKITVSPKGFGSENMSAIKMFNPSSKSEDIIEFIVQTVVKAGSNPCPPIVVGVGIGGNFEYSATLAKKALIRDVDIRNSDEFYKDLEEKVLSEINKTGIGPQGFGGAITALSVNIEVFPTHIAGLPVAVNMGCYVNRHKTKII